MALSVPSQSKIPTKNPQLGVHGSVRPAPAGARARRSTGGGSARVSGETREAARGDDRVVVEVAGGVTVYPARGVGDRWRAVWYEGGRRRQCESVTEAGLAAKLEKITERLAADAPGMERPGSDLIGFYLSPDRHPAGPAWSRKHADTQRRLCARYLAPVIGGLACQDITAGDMQAVVNAAPTAKEGTRVQRCLSALVGAGINGGYFVNPRLKQVHWQPAGRPAPQPPAAIAGESALFVDPAAIPAPADVEKLGQALAALAESYELMASFAAYTGLRWGELAALTADQVNQGTRVVAMDRKVIEIGGKLYVELPKGRKRRRTIYPRVTSAGYPLAQKVAARLGQARAGQASMTNPRGLVFPSPRGAYICWPTRSRQRIRSGPHLPSSSRTELPGHGRGRPSSHWRTHQPAN